MEKITVSVSELGEMLGIGRNAAYALVHQKGFPSVQLGKRIVIPLEGLRDWLARGGTEQREVRG